MAETTRQRPAKRADAEETCARILDAAEQLFAEQGFAGASMRALTGLADVNLAAVHYHFGSKEGLLSAVLQRRVAPVNALRMEALNRLQAAEGNPDVRGILKAFFLPLEDASLTRNLQRLIARLYGDPNARTSLKSEFGPTIERFVAALESALPEATREEVEWRFHFAIGSMLHVLTFDSPPGLAAVRGSELRPEHLLEFAVAGICQPTAEKKS